LERLITEILVGRRILFTNCEYAPVIICRGLTGPEKIISHIEYERSLKEALSLGLRTEEELKKQIYRNGDWSLKQDAAITELEKAIKDIQAEIYESKYKVSQQKSAQKKLKSAKEKHQELILMKHHLMSNSAESYANEYRYYWNLHKMIYREDQSPLWIDYHSMEETDREIVSAITKCYIKDFCLPQEEIRKIARSGLWRIYYSSCPSSTYLFNRPTSDFDENQINTLYWSSVYDSVMKMMEPPGEDVMSDDSKFDSWLENYNKEQKKKRAEDSISKAPTKGGNAREEMFIVTDDEGAKQFYNDVGQPTIDPKK
jgi:hypothetical protein